MLGVDLDGSRGSWQRTYDGDSGMAGSYLTPPAAGVSGSFMSAPVVSMIQTKDGP
jgi:hypothetical protein